MKSQGCCIAGLLHLRSGPKEFVNKLLFIGICFMHDHHSTSSSIKLVSREANINITYKANILFLILLKIYVLVFWLYVETLVLLKILNYTSWWWGADCPKNVLFYLKFTWKYCFSLRIEQSWVVFLFDILKIYVNSFIK